MTKNWQLRPASCGPPMQANSICGGCGARLDLFGDHTVSCASCGLYARHNRLRDAFAVELRLAGVPVRTEVQLPGSQSRPADIFIADPESAVPTAVDVSVVHPLQLSAFSAEDAPGTFAASRELATRTSSAAECAAAGWNFVPICAETTGAWGLKRRNACGRSSTSKV